MKQLVIASLASLTALLSGVASPVHAQAPPPTEACDYQRTVSPERAARASALTDQAFAAHRKLDFDRAAALYTEALEHWDRPDIRRQAGMTYFYSARLMPAYHYLLEALRCGREWIDPEDYEEARILMERLSPWFGEVEVRVTGRHDDDGDDMADVRGTFDDEPWFQGAGTHRRVVVAGQHVVRVTRPGHVPAEKLVFVSPGERAVISPRLLPEAEKTIYTRRWQRWQPWAVVGAGVAVALVGGGLQWRAHDQFQEYDAALFALCQDADGCASAEQAGVQATYDSARLKNRLAVGAFVTGGLALAAGAAFVFLNQPKARRHPDAGRADLEVQPMVSPERAGVMLQYRF